MRIDTIPCQEARGIAATIRRMAGCELGTWQQITIINPGNHPIGRKLLVQIVGGVIHAAFFGSIEM